MFLLMAVAEDSSVQPVFQKLFEELQNMMKNNLYIFYFFVSVSNSYSRNKKWSVVLVILLIELIHY